MDKRRIKKLIKTLRFAGKNKDASVLQEILDGKHRDALNIRISQLEETPFIPSRQKFQGYEPQLNKEKSWLRSKLPMSGQHLNKFIQDPRVQAEISSLGGEEAIGYGMPYRDPVSISKTSNPEEMIERIKTTGWPPQGLSTSYGNVLDVDPKHPVIEVGPRGGKTYGEEFDFGEGAGIGYIPKNSDEYIYDQQENLPPELSEMIQKIWGEGKKQFAINVESAIDRFNKRLESWMTDSKNQMLATNFMTQINQVVTGNRMNNDVWASNLNGENLSAVILKRMQNVQNIRNFTIKKASESEKYSDLQANLYTKYIEDLNKGLNYPSVEWLNKLMLVYGQDPRSSSESKEYIMDIISDNPLEIKYPQSFIENIILPYKESKRKGGGGGGGTKKELTWSDILSRDFRPITTGIEETVNRRKIIEDVDIWKGLVGAGGKPLITSQKDIIIFNYNKEIEHLLELLKDLQRILNIRDKFESGKLEDARKNQETIREMNVAIIKFARTLEQHYKQGEIATIEGKLMGNYSVGSETKLEIYIKSLYIIQAYEAWLNAVGNSLEQEDIDLVVGLNEPDDFNNIEKIEADESMIPKNAFTYQDMIRIANTLDKYGMTKLADSLESIY